MFKKDELYIIAEIGVNHEGNLVLAKRLIDLAKDGGAHAAKFQSYKADKIAARQSPSYWDTSKEKTTSQFELFQKYDGFGPYEYNNLAEHCRNVGIDFLSTPFDLEAVDFLDPLMPFFKVASADITNLPLLKKVASKGKPVVLSTGSSRIGEIGLAVEELKKAGAPRVVLLHCVLNYPTPNDCANIDMIKGLLARFPDLEIGYSDHTVPDDEMTALSLAYINGARIIEKHFTHDKSLPGNDHYHAMNAQDLQVFFKQVEKIDALSGEARKFALPTEAPAREHARRSVVTLGSLKAGETLSETNTICKRPAHGISPIYFKRILGKKISRDLPDDHILSWSDVEVTEPHVVGIIQARMGSLRLPGKMLKKLGNHRIIDWVVQRMKQSIEIDELVLATTENSADDELAAIAIAHGIKVFRGSESDVVDRFFRCASIHKADAVVRICADNPFVDATEVDRAVQLFRATRKEYVFNHVPKYGNQYPDGFGAEVFAAELLEEMSKYAVDEEREHLSLYVWNNEFGVDIGKIVAPEGLQRPELKFDVDTQEQLERLENLASRMELNTSAFQIVKLAETAI